MSRIRIVVAVVLFSSAMALTSQAVVVDFTGGTVTRLDATTETTNNVVSWDNVDYYDQGGFRMDFFPNSAGGFSTHVGNYYGLPLNDVIHSHWITGDFGTVTSVEITKIGGGTFDLNYFILTSNTDRGGSFASGLEQAYVQGFDSFNIATGPAVLLPSEDWSFPASQVFLGPDFDGVDKVVFTVTNPVDCFGMDEFYLDQEFVPEPSTCVLGTLIAAAGLVMRRRR
jgi:hypothetical protein